jgi:hypothetical protein
MERLGMSQTYPLASDAADPTQHEGKLPYEDDERKEFKALLNSWRKKGDEENFDEAIGQAYKVSMKSKVGYLRCVRDTWLTHRRYRTRYRIYWRTRRSRTCRRM